MRTFLRYGQVPTTELIGQLADSENFRLFPFLSSCKDKLGQGYLFPEAWRRSLSEWKDSALTARDMEILESVAEVLGGSDSESQSNTLELTVSLLEQNLQEALEAKNTNGKLYRSLGVLIGIGAAVFMI